jgi:hypothetical protein
MRCPDFLAPTVGRRPGVAGLSSTDWVLGPGRRWDGCRAAAGGLWPIAWCHSRSQVGAQGQRLGRCRTGTRAGRASRPGTVISCRRRVAPRATVWPWPAMVPAVWSRLRAIAAHRAQAEAPKCPDGRCAKGPSIRSANTVFDDRVTAVDDVGLRGRQVCIGEERVIAPHREQCVGVAGVLDPAHHQPSGNPILGGGERSVGHLGDLGVGDARPGVGIHEYVQVA